MRTETPQHSTLMSHTAVDLCQELAALMTRQTDGKGSGVHSTAISQLKLMREEKAPTEINGAYEPALAIVVQGKKRTLLTEEVYYFSAAQCLVVSVDLPVNGLILEATPDKPYLALNLSLDSAELCNIITQTKLDTGKPDSSVRGLFVSDADTSLIDCAIRLTRLLDSPKDIPFLAPVIVREIYYRILTGDQGEAVRQIATSGSNMQRIAEVIKQINDNFAMPLRVNELAEQANMSLSSFHRHFKAITSMSPLQYQKHLRLLKARQLMLTESADATYTSYQVGYESPSQFSREYSRLFGAPPMQDIERLRIV